MTFLRYKLPFLCLLLSLFRIPAQTVYPAVNISLVGQIAPNTATATVNKYSGCWGWYQASKHKEYALSGTSNGVYFIDITSPATPTVSDFVPGRNNSVWRELKTYQHYCYIISDDASPNMFQIVDMQYLPDSVHVVYQGTDLFERGHTIWIDQDKMYIASMTLADHTYKPMAVFSLATPTAPVLLRTLDQDIGSNLIASVHDMYVLNDTIFASGAYQGLWLLKLNPATPTITILGSYTGYPQAGYNHSSFLTSDRKYVIFCDEVPAEKPIHFVNVQNFGNIQPVKDFKPSLHTTPHNPYIIGSKWAIVSCYQDGLYIFDISKPDTIKQAGFFDTFPQGGVSANDYGGSAYNGNWGAYPFLPSGVIIANDMTNGVFLLDATGAYNTNTSSPVAVAAAAVSDAVAVYPNPSSEVLNIRCSGMVSRVSVYNVFGQKVQADVSAHAIDISSLAAGTYVAEIVTGEAVARCRFVKSN